MLPGSAPTYQTIYLCASLTCPLAEETGGTGKCKTTTSQIQEFFPHNIKHIPMNLDNKDLIGRESLNPYRFL